MCRATISFSTSSNVCVDRPGHHYYFAIKHLIFIGFGTSFMPKASAVSFPRRPLSIVVHSNYAYHVRFLKVPASETFEAFLDRLDEAWRPTFVETLDTMLGEPNHTRGGGCWWFALIDLKGEVQPKRWRLDLEEEYSEMRRWLQKRPAIYQAALIRHVGLPFKPSERYTRRVNAAI